MARHPVWISPQNDQIGLRRTGLKCPLDHRNSLGGSEIVKLLLKYYSYLESPITFSISQLQLDGTQQKL